MSKKKSSSIEIILGAPGTGKTTTLIDRVCKHIENGGHANKIVYATFTKQAAKVAIDRAIDKFKLTKLHFPYFRTIHSLAYYVKRYTPLEVVRDEDLVDFGGMYGYDLKTKIDRITMLPTYGRGNGDSLLHAYDLHANKQTPFSLLSLRTREPVLIHEAELFKMRWEHYKTQRGIKDFADFLKEPVAVPGLELVIVDEAQDLTALQWAFIRESFRGVPEIILAGDDDQAVYEWTGADLAFFLRVDAKITKLVNSHRCCRAVTSLCNAVSAKIKYRYEKELIPTHEDGEVHYIRDLTELDIRKGEWLLLTRRNKDLPRYTNLAREQGRLYVYNKVSVCVRKSIKAYLIYTALQRGEELKGFMITRYLPLTLIDKKDSYTKDDFDFDFNRSWQDVIKMSDSDKKYIELCLENGEDFTKQPTVHIMTMHGAKGAEADNVFIDAKLKGIPLQTYRQDPDSERRVWYVGFSRAKHKLVLFNADSNPCIEAPLEHGRVSRGAVVPLVESATVEGALL